MVHNFAEIFEKSKTEKELIEIWEYKSDTNFYAGYVVDYNEEIVEIKHYTRYGKFDGVITLQNQSIESVNYNNDYLKALDCVIEFSTVIDEVTSSNISFENIENWEYEIISQLEKNKEVISSILINGNYYTGYILSTNETHFTMLIIGTLGENKGECLLKIEDVSEIKIQDLDDRKRDLLFKWRNSKV